HREEVGGQNPRRLGPQERPPARVRSSRCGSEPRAPQDRADGRRGHPQAELEELALNPDASPSAVLPGHPQDEGADLRIERRTTLPCLSFYWSTSCGRARGATAGASEVGPRTGSTGPAGWPGSRRRARRGRAVAGEPTVSADGAP